MRFQFRFQVLLNWKKSLEELSQLRLAEQNKELQGQEKDIENVKQKRSAYDQEIQRKSSQGLPAGEMLTYQHYLEKSYQDLLAKEEKKELTLREIEKERKKLMDLTKQRKILEKLKEKRIKKFLRHVEQKEQKDNDERALRENEPLK
jgi:flagellar protein FliJ